VNRRQLRALSQETLRQLGMWPPLDVDLLIDRLAEHRGKPIDLVASTNLMGYQTFGITGSSEDADCDVIMYEARITGTHRLMIILHELAHMICKHPLKVIDHSYRADYTEEFQEISPQMLAQVLGGRPPGRGFPRRRRSRLGRSLYDDPVEWEAETMATIMVSWVPGLGGYLTPAPTDPLQAILGDNPAW
jgi:hypothetical protein